MRLPVRHFLPLAALIVLASCGSSGDSKIASAPPPANGPAADYPMVIGDPFTVGGTTYTPADKLNSDEVGYASIGGAGEGISAAHKTLPMPSYVEVTTLDNGKTILVRVERRGPMSNDTVIELSSGAAAQLGIAGAAKAPVRVRRVNPPEPERAMLRGGGQVPERMDTPKGLLAVLMRKLEKQEPLGTPSPAPSTTPNPSPVKAPVPVAASKPAAAPSRKPSPTPAAKPAQTVKAATNGSFAVQVASFSTEERAKSAAGKLGGKVVKGGRYWLARLGPFANRADAAGALAKVKAAGYRDARIQRAD